MKKYLIIAMVALAAFACKKAEPVTPEVTLTSPAEVTINTEGGISTVTFTSNVPWKATINNSNFNVTPTSGEAGSASVKVTALQNETEDPVKATLTITAESASAKVEFTQLQKNCLSLPVAEKEIDWTAQTTSFKVLANVAYTATPSASWVKVVSTKGAVETTVNLEVEANKTTEARQATITVSGEGKKAEFTLKQGAFAPEFSINGTTENIYADVPTAGGNGEFEVKTNVDYEVTVYAETFTWQTVERDGNKFKVTIAKNDGWDPRTSYVKFTVPDIQVPVYDDYGEPTGETRAFVQRVYMAQAGSTTTAWRTEFYWDLYNYSAGRFAIAESGDYIAVTNNYIQGVTLFKKADGTFVSTLALPFAPTGITNDDAGNLLITTGGNYPIDDTTWELKPEEQVPLQIYALKKGSTSIADAKLLVNYYDGFYGYGLDNIRVRGDVYGDAVITVASAGYGTSYIVAWEINNGIVSAEENSYTDYVTFYSQDGIYSSANIIGYPLGNKMTDGIYGAGYATVDGSLEVSGTYYGLMYNPGTWSMTDWTFIENVESLSQSWANAVTAMDYIEYGGKKIICAVSFSFFAYADWDYDGNVDSYMPGYIYLLDVTNAAAPTILSCQEYYAAESNWQYGSSADVTLTVEDGNLVAYLIDASASHIQKRVYPAL